MCRYIRGGHPVPPSAVGLAIKPNGKVVEKQEFDNIQDLIVSPPAVSSSTKLERQPPTLLEREASAVRGSIVISRKEKVEAVNGLLDLLELNGVSSGYAFEFVRHAGELIDELIVEAKQGSVSEWIGNVGNTTDLFPIDSKQEFSGNLAHLRSQAEETVDDLRELMGVHHGNGLGIGQTCPRRERKINKMLDTGNREMPESKECVTSHEDLSTLAFRVSLCAERRGLARLVPYFHIIGMKAQNIPKILPFVDGGIQKVMSNVDFVRSLGLNYGHLPVILVTWPQLLSYHRDVLALKVEYLVSLGLTPKDIGKMVVKYPQILGRDVESDLCKSVETLESVGVEVRNLKKLVVRYPVLLTEHASKELDPLIEFLSELGVKKEHIGRMLIKRPSLLDSDVEKDLLPVGYYLRELNATPSDIDKILTSFPQLFCYDVEKDFRPTVEHLEKLGLEPEVIGKVFRRHPQLLKNRHQVDQKLEFLLGLGLQQEDLGKLLYKAPQLLCLSTSENMLPTVEFLESIGVKGPLLLKALKYKPMILAYSVEAKLKPNVNFLQTIASQPDDLAKLISRHPQLLTLSVAQNLEPTVNYFLELKFSRDDVTAMVRCTPSLLGFSVSTVLAPKYAYLVDVMKRSNRDAVRFPQYFTYSLNNRIIPRHQRLGKAFDSLTLSSVYSCGPGAFERRARKWLTAMSE